MNMLSTLKNKLHIWFGKAIDIRLKAKYPANVLSNLYPNEFEYDGVKCGSMEGFLQALKFKDKGKQRCICYLSGKEAKSKSEEGKGWKEKQLLWWQGRPINRRSVEFKNIIEEAYLSLFSQNKTFREALLSTTGMKLYHTIGISDPTNTILTTEEFCKVLNFLRERADDYEEYMAETKRLKNLLEKQNSEIEPMSNSKPVLFRGWGGANCDIMMFELFPDYFKDGHVCFIVENGYLGINKFITPQIFVEKYCNGLVYVDSVVERLHDHSYDTCCIYMNVSNKAVRTPSPWEGYGTYSDLYGEPYKIGSHFTRHYDYLISGHAAGEFSVEIWKTEGDIHTGNIELLYSNDFICK